MSMIAFGDCVICRNPFTYNPLKVPSTTAITGQREPICRPCMALINDRRAEQGLPPFEIAVDAYDAESCLE